MKIPLTVDMTNKVANSGGGAWSPPVLTFNESLTLALRFTTNIEGTATETSLDVHSLSAAIGEIDTRPEFGTFALQIGPDPQSDANTTAALRANVSATELQAAINALTGVTGTYGAAAVSFVDGSFLLVFGTGAAEVPLKVVKNRLLPIAFGVAGASQVDAQWIHELRITVAPVAFTSGSARILPPAPFVTEVQSGGSDGDIFWNEIQALHVPADFRGSYQLKKGYARTSLLSISDGSDEIQAALAPLGNGFKVTNPLPNTANIEFIGDFEGTGQPLLEVIASNAPEGDLTFTLDLNTEALARRLRAQTQITLPLEVKLTATDEDNVVRPKIAFRTDVTIARGVNFDQLEETPDIDWLVPPSPRNYIPFDPSQVITGQQFYQMVIGNGSATSFSITHGLDTEVVFVFARENHDGGRQIVQGIDFTATIDSANQVTLTALTGAPATNAWAAFVMSAQTVAAFAEGLLITTGQVINLDTILDDLGSRVTHLETLLPGNATTTDSGAGQSAFTIELQEFSEALFSGGITDFTKLPARAPCMLPAINRPDNDGALPTSPLPTPGAGKLYTTASAVLIPGGGGIRTSSSIAGGFVGSDGRINYPMTRSGSTSSYFSTPFERTLFEMAINDQMFPAGTKCTVLFQLATQLIGATSRAQWVLVIEKGAFPKDTVGSPDTADINLQNVTWDTANVLLRQQLLLTSALETGTFGCVITNNLSGITANALKYTRVINANSGAPASANFAIRARLINFDTENSATNARGWVSYALKKPEGGTLGATIV